MNILIVDDEYFIVKNILESVNWSQIGIKRQFMAYSARQAKHILECPEDIDIVLTDIEMPKESGLELVQWLHDNNFHPVVLVLTGHQRFDYAQTAVNLHIFSYILKPIDWDKLTDKLRAAVQEVRRKTLYEKERLNIETRLAGDPSDLITIIKEYVHTNLSSPELCRLTIAEEVHMNPDYVSHTFSTRTGMSLSSYIMDERMSTAKNLLATTGYSIQQICDQTGFTNISYFYRQFKKNCNVTPQQYRERHQNGK